MARGERHVSFGEFFNQKRRELRISLREFCRRYGLDVGNISKLERGKLAPPHGPNGRTKLEEYATYLEIEEGSGDWYTFLDLASIDSGQIPEDIQSNAKLIPALPLLFRSLRGNKVDENDLRKIIDIVKEA